MNEDRQHSLHPEDWSSEALIREFHYASRGLAKYPYDRKKKDRIQIALIELKKRLNIEKPISLN